MKNEKATAPSAIATPPFTLSFFHIYEVSEVSHEYEITVWFDENKVDLGPVRANMDAAAADLWGKTKPKKMIDPWQSGNDIYEEKTSEDKKCPEQIKGKTVIKFKSQSQPVVYDVEGNVITDPKEIYSGCLCRAVVQGYAYDNKYNKGLRLNLVSIQKLRDGRRIGGSSVDSQAVLAEAGDADLSAFDDYEQYEDSDF